jgi:hypothetical protein
MMERGKCAETCTYLLLSGMLFQEWIVSSYCKMEGSRLDWVRHNQTEIRAEMYQGLQDCFNRTDIVFNPGRVGTRIVLPSSFTGSPRHMNQLYQDAMGIVRQMGKPDLFITFTCNPKWPEIQRELRPGEDATDRPDLCCRVFNQKVKLLLKRVVEDQVLGRIAGRVWTIEFQSEFQKNPKSSHTAVTMHGLPTCLLL